MRHRPACTPLQAVSSPPAQCGHRPAAVAAVDRSDRSADIGYTAQVSTFLCMHLLPYSCPRSAFVSWSWHVAGLLHTGLPSLSSMCVNLFPPPQHADFCFKACRLSFAARMQRCTLRLRCVALWRRHGFSPKLCTYIPSAPDGVRKGTVEA